MRKVGLFLIPAFIIFHSLGFAQAQSYEMDAAKSQVWFEVRATMHTVHGEAVPSISKVVFDRATGEVKAPVQIEIPVSSMETGNKRRDKAMHKMFQAGEYPSIIWKADSMACRQAESARSMICDAQGTLKIRNIEQKSSFPIFLTFSDEGIKASGFWTVNRKDFDLKTPSLGGLVRVGEDVKIKFDTLWLTAGQNEV